MSSAYVPAELRERVRREARYRPTLDGDTAESPEQTMLLD